MRPARHVAGAALMLLAASGVPRPVYAQAPVPPTASREADPPGPYVIDLRGTMLGVPQTSNFYPDIPGDTVIPARGFGLQTGAHVYPFAVGKWPLGFGVEIYVARATARTPVTSSTSTAGAVDVQAAPDVEVTDRIIAPQVSLNFGTARGWSYLSSGVGRARVKSTAGAATATTSKVAPHLGAGARWFVTDHIGIGFDLRAHWLGSRGLFAASAGLSLK